MTRPRHTPARPLPAGPVLRYLAGCRRFVLLETRRFDRENYRSFIFTAPLACLRADRLDQLPPLLAAIRAQLAAGRWLAGFFAYEAAAAFEAACPAPSRPAAAPLAFFYACAPPLVFDHRRGCFLSRPPFSPGGPAGSGLPPARVSGLSLDVPRERYLRQVRRARAHIAAGDTYQVNYTVRQRFRVSGPPLRLYADLAARQSVAYGAVVGGDDFTVLSLSPELFFRRHGDRLVARPMKGTLARGRTGAEDRRRAGLLRRSAKNRAENLMIVDLLRNDLGRLAVPGGVRVDALFDIERYETLFQMTSTISARLAGDPDPATLFTALFPCGSVTGAPKVRTMEIIAALEDAPRGVYTGAIGYFAPGREAVFNVPIRTLFLRDGHGEMGIGGGIVADSDPAGEFDECRLKALFLTGAPRPFLLLETMRWGPGSGWYWLEAHLRRLAGTADYFHFPFPEAVIRARLARLARRFAAAAPAARLVRLRLERGGRVRLSARPLPPLPAFPRYGLAAGPVDSADRFLYHKTTRRARYSAALRRARAAGLYDVVFANERGELTEGTFNNLFIERDGVMYTPPVAAGLLPGVLRAQLLSSGRAREAILRPADLDAAATTWLGNSVRGLVRVTRRGSTGEGEG